MLLRTAGLGGFKSFHVLILGCLSLEQAPSSIRSRSVCCPLPGGALKRAGDSQGRQKPISAAVHVKGDGMRGVPGESLIHLNSGTAFVSGRQKKKKI